MAFTKPNVYTFTAGGAISKNTFVKLGSSDESVIACAVAEEKSIGVAMNDAASGELVEIALANGGAPVKAGATITRGDYVSTNGSGLAKVAGAASHVAGIAMESGVSGDVIAIQGACFYKV